MAYMNPQQYLKAITGIGRGSRYTAFEDPNEADPNEILKVTGPYQARRGAPNFSGSRGPTYDKIPIQQASTGTGLTSLQKGLEQFNQQQQGFVADRPQVPPMSEQPSLYPSDIGQAAPGYGYGPSVPQGSDDPRGMMSKIGGFFTRPGMGQTLATLGSGIATESDRPGGSFWTGLARGSEAAVLGEQRRQMIEEQRAAREEEKRIRDEDRARRIVAEDLAISQAAARREAYGGIFPVDEETGERGEFNIEAWRDSFATALEQGDTQFAGVLIQMRPEDPEEIPLGEFKQMTRPQRHSDGTWRDVFYRTGADGTVETQLSTYTVAPPAGARAGGTGRAGEGITKDEQTGNAAIEAIDHLVDTGGWMALTGMVRDTDEFRRLRGELLLENPDATATQIMEYTRDAWGDAEGLMPDKWWDPSSWKEDLGDEASMLLMAVLQDTSGQGGEGDWLITKAIKNKGREWAQRNEHAVRFAVAQAQALQAINPMVRYLSGAQMTNAEAMRYYGALIPTWGDAPEVANAKMRGLTVMAKAMRGDSEAREIVDMSGFEDDDRLTAEENLRRRNEWARTQINRVMQGELGRIDISASQAEREEDVAAARARQEEALSLFDADGIPINPSAFPIADPFATRAATDEFSMFRSGYTPTAEERARAGMTSAGVATDTTAPVDYDWIRSYGANPQRARGLLMQQIGPGP